MISIKSCAARLNGIVAKTSSEQANKYNPAQFAGPEDFNIKHAEQQCDEKEIIETIQMSSGFVNQK